MAMEEKTDIQKLKDLFIEYHWEWVYGIIEPEHWIYLREAMQARAPYIISKKYWFIRWLVENDKIDFNKRPELYTFKAETETRWLNNMVDGSWHYESLLMLLSIQDNPIDFLSSILK